MKEYIHPGPDGFSRVYHHSPQPPNEHFIKEGAGVDRELASIPTEQDVEELIKGLNTGEGEFVTVGEVANKPTGFETEVLRLEAFEEERQGVAVGMVDVEGLDRDRGIGEASW